jgi:hypothetical protein
LSSLPLAINPSSVAAAAYTRAVCPTSSAMHSPLSVQTLRVWSWEAETTPTFGSSARPLRHQGAHRGDMLGRIAGRMQFMSNPSGTPE